MNEAELKLVNYFVRQRELEGGVTFGLWHHCCSLLLSRSSEREQKVSTKMEKNADRFKVKDKTALKAD